MNNFRSLTRRQTFALVSIIIIGVLLVVLPIIDAPKISIALVGIATTLIVWESLTFSALLLGALTIATMGGFVLAGSVDGETLILQLVVLISGYGLYLQDQSKPATEEQTTPVQTAKTTRTPEFTDDVSMEDLNTRIRVTVDGLIRSASAVREVVTEQSTGANEQSQVIDMATANIDEFLALANRAMDQTTSLSENAERATTISSEGQQALSQAIDSMGRIREQVSVIRETAVHLAQLTRRIDRIISSVSEIATQSNLLALNASIEAARAGIHGRGFAVVADEVRTLAQQSTEAANQVRAILSKIQEAVGETVQATEIGMEQVDSGVVVTQSANRIMAQLDNNVTASFESIKSITGVLHQQSTGMEDIAIEMQRINRVTQQYLVSTKVAEQVSRNLSELADQLQGSGFHDPMMPQMS